MARKAGFFERILQGSSNEPLHVFDDGTSRAVVKKEAAGIWISTGMQFCPDCHTSCVHHENGSYWECPQCKYSITDDEVAYGDGYPTEESTYEDDYSDFYSDETDDEEEWERFEDDD